MKRYAVYEEDLREMGDSDALPGSSDVWCVVVRNDDAAQLRTTLSLAEEGLANYAQEVGQLKPVADAAVAYARAWMATKGERGPLLDEWSTLFNAVLASLRVPQPAEHE